MNALNDASSLSRIPGLPPSRELPRDGRPVPIEGLLDAPGYTFETGAAKTIAENAFLLAVDLGRLTALWSDLPSSDGVPFDRPWFEVTPIDDYAVLLPDEADTTPRLLAFTATGGGYKVVVFSLSERVITAADVVGECDFASDLKSCAGLCQSGNPCAFVRIVGGGPPRAFCKC